MRFVSQPVDSPRLFRATVFCVAIHAGLWIVWLLGLCRPASLSEFSATSI